MIQLTVRAEFAGTRDDEVVCRAAQAPSGDQREATLSQDGDTVVISQAEWTARIRGGRASDLDGDVLLIQPRHGLIQRLIRGGSRHNTLLVTEQCDQLCVMCSQPPKKTHNDQYRHFKAAAMLAPLNTTIGVSGGEPTLHKADLFDFLEFSLTMRPDLRFHVLSNGQHFQDDDIGFLSSEGARRVRWGVPIYADDPSLHDRIVGKDGAHKLLMRGLSVLCRSGAPTELRTVVMQDNVHQLGALARFVTSHIPFADPWAIMQLERAGFARNRWQELFFDHSTDFAPIAEALEIAKLHRVPAILYNFPLCTLPRVYRRLAPSTISDWKRRFESVCEGCVAKPYCGGFFEWHPSDASYQTLGLK